MPFIRIETNLPLTDAQKRDLAVKASESVAEAMGKPVSAVFASVHSNMVVTCGAAHEPCAFVGFKNVGLTEELAVRASEVLGTLLEKEIGLDPDRVLIDLVDLDPAYVGKSKTTIKIIRGL